MCSMLHCSHTADWATVLAWILCDAVTVGWATVIYFSPFFLLITLKENKWPKNLTETVMYSTNPRGRLGFWCVHWLKTHTQPLQQWDALWCHSAISTSLYLHRSCCDVYNTMSFLVQSQVCSHTCSFPHLDKLRSPLFANRESKAVLKLFSLTDSVLLAAICVIFIVFHFPKSTNLEIFVAPGIFCILLKDWVWCESVDILR